MPKKKKPSKKTTRRNVNAAAARGESQRSADALFRRRVQQHLDTVGQYVDQSGGDVLVAARLASEDVAAAVDETRRLLSQWDALDALAWLRLANLPLAEDYQESTHDGLLAIVELAGLILLERPNSGAVNAPVGASNTNMPPPPAVVAQLCADVSRSLRKAIDAAAIRYLLQADDWSRQTKVSWRTVEREVLLRNPGYPHIESAHLRSLLSRPPLREMMSRHLGFDVDEALAIIDVFEDRLGATIEARTRFARREVDHLLTSTEPLFESLRQRLGSRLRESAGLFGLAAVQHHFGQHLAITLTEIAEVSGVAPDSVRHFLDVMGQTFQGQSHDGMAAVEDFLAGKNPWRLRPIIKEGETYTALDVGLLLFGLREVVEAALPDIDRGIYAAEVACWMEDLAVEAVTNVVRPDAVYRNLEYITVDGNLAELDALIVVDRVAIAIEAKHVAFSARARTGDRMRLKRDLGRLVGKTLTQADQVRRAITRDGSIALRGGERLALPEVRRVFPIALTLEDVSTISGTVSDLISGGFVDFGGTPPWLVSLHDLMVINEIIEGPAQLLAYLDQHERAVSYDILSVSEELDIFMMFLQDGLWLGDFLDEEGGAAARLVSQSRTDDLDSYYLSLTAQVSGPARSKPRQAWSPKGFRELLGYLESGRPPGWTTATINLQMVDGQVRKQLGSALRRLALQSRRDQRMHDETRCFVDPRFARFGITVMSGPPSLSRGDLDSRLVDMVTARKYVQTADSWTGLSIRGEGAVKLASLVQLDAPWVIDANLADLVQKLGMRPASEVAAR